MAISIKDSETDRLARKLAKLTGEGITTAIKIALKERLERATKVHRKQAPLNEELNEIALRCAALPILDTRSADEILGYDDTGVPS